MKQNILLLINQKICQRDSKCFTHNICQRDSYTGSLLTIYAKEIASVLHTIYAKEIAILVLYTQYMPNRYLYLFFTHNICQRDSEFFTHIICQRDIYTCSLHTIYAKEIVSSLRTIHTAKMRETKSNMNHFPNSFYTQSPKNHRKNRCEAPLDFFRGMESLSGQINLP